MELDVVERDTQHAVESTCLLESLSFSLQMSDFSLAMPESGIESSRQFTDTRGDTNDIMDDLLSSRSWPDEDDDDEGGVLHRTRVFL